MPVTQKMNMQHFLFVLLKRPLNASREKRYINTRILLHCVPERDRGSIPPLSGEREMLWAGGGAGGGHKVPSLAPPDLPKEVLK